MAGNSITKQFNIGTGTVMVGPMDQVKNLTPEEHSIGLIKNFSLTSETTEVTLTEGIRNREVDSQVTGIDTTLTFEVYEYTAANLAWAAGLDGADFVSGAVYKLATAITGGTSATTLDIASETDISSKFVAETKLQIQSATQDDRVFLATVQSSSYDSDAKKLTVTLKTAIPTGWAFAANDKVITCNIIMVGSETAQPYVGVKIVGILSNGEPVTVICPKAKITGGMTLAFTTDDYSNMPYEIKPYALTPEDEMYSEFKNDCAIANCYIYKR